MKTAIKKFEAQVIKNADKVKGGDNIVPNGSFESVGKKPKRLGAIES